METFERKLKRSIIGDFICILIGIFFVCFAFYNLHIENKFFKTAKSTVGTIVDINEIKSSKNKSKIEYSFIVKYSVNDIEYLENSNYYNKYKNIGDSITIYYEPNNPKSIKCEKKLLLHFFKSFGIGTFLIVITILVNKKRPLFDKSNFIG